MHLFFHYKTRILALCGSMEMVELILIGGYENDTVCLSEAVDMPLKCIRQLWCYDCEACGRNLGLSN